MLIRKQWNSLFDIAHIYALINRENNDLVLLPGRAIIIRQIAMKEFSEHNDNE